MDHRTLADALSGWDSGDGPLYERLAATLRRLLQDGVLLPGTRLPAERRLSRDLGVSRGTVVAALDLLRSEGLLRSRQGSGTVVAGGAGTAASGAEPGVSALLGPSLIATRDDVDELIDLRAAAWSDASHLPPRLLDTSGDDLAGVRATDGYFPAGWPPLRSVIAEYLSERGLPTGPEQVLVTGGGQQAISLLVAMFVPPGGKAILEALTFPGALDVVRASGARPIPVPLEETGVDVEALARTVAAERPHLVYLIPSVHNPTGALLGEEARQRLAYAAEQWEPVTVDDEALAESLFEGSLPPPVAAACRDPDQDRVFTIGSASKWFWGGLRVGWVRGSEEAIGRLTRLKVVADLSSPVISQAITARLLRHRHELAEARRERLRSRVEALQEAVDRCLPGWEYRPGAGGLAAWVRMPSPDAPHLSQLALREGVGVVPGTVCAADGAGRDHLRISLGQPPERIEAGVERLSRAWRSLRGTHPAGSMEVIL